MIEFAFIIVTLSLFLDLSYLSLISLYMHGPLLRPIEYPLVIFKDSHQDVVSCHMFIPQARTL